MVTGPGNIYVVAAKRHLRGQIGIDAEAGPTEIAVLADEGADPRYVAADLISQAEHDPMAGSVLITPSRTLAEAVNSEIAAQVDRLATADRLRLALSGEQSAIVLVADLEQGIQVTNAYAAEHLEIQTADAGAIARRIRNAGAIFIGPNSPVPLGDYSAGSTHVLPTGGAARYSSGLTVRSFLRSIHVIEYDRQALGEVGERVQVFAIAERRRARQPSQSGWRDNVSIDPGASHFELPLRRAGGEQPYGAPQLRPGNAERQRNPSAQPRCASDGLSRPRMARTVIATLIARPTNCARTWRATWAYWAPTRSGRQYSNDDDPPVAGFGGRGARC